MESEKKQSSELLPVNAIRVETALSRYPVHRLARKGNIAIEVSEGDRDSAFRWKVSYNSEYGQPGPLAYKLDTLIINRRIEEAYRPIPRLIKLGSLRDICKELGISEGKNKTTIKTSLYQNASAFITAKIHYKSSDGTERVLEAGFTRYNVIFTGEKLPDGRKADGVYIILNDVFIQVINGAMTRPLDYDYLKSLPPAPQRFYELLSYQMYAALKYDRPRAKLTYSDFCDHAPQMRHEDWERVRSQMNKIHRPHRESGYIAQIDYQQTTDHQGKADWVILYQPGPKARAEFKAFNKRGGPTILEIEPLEDTPPALLDLTEFVPNYANPIVQELIDRGVSPDAAAKLEATCSVEDIQLQIEHFDWLKNTKHKLYPDNPGGWFIKAVMKKFTPPPQFKTKAKRQQEEEMRLENARQQREAKRIQKEKETQDAQEEKARKAAADAYLAGLTPEERQELDGEFRKQGGHGPGKIPFGDIFFRNYVIQKLGLGRETELQS